MRRKNNRHGSKQNRKCVSLLFGTTSHTAQEGENLALYKLDLRLQKRSMSKVEIREIDPVWVTSALLFNREDRIDVLQVIRSPPKTGGYHPSGSRGLGRDLWQSARG